MKPLACLVLATLLPSLAAAQTAPSAELRATIEGVDFPYLAKVTQLNAATMAALALAPPPPDKVTIAGAVTPDTKVSWTPVPGAARYRVWKRSTTEPQWRDFREAPVGATELILKGVNIDDWFFGVSAISADGHESPVEFPAPAGSFFPAGAN